MTVTVAKLAKLGEVSRVAIYKAIKAKKLTFHAGKADLGELRDEWSRKHTGRVDSIGPAIERAIKAMPADAPGEASPAKFSPKVQAFYDKIMGEYKLEGDSAELLLAACDCLQKAQLAQDILDRDGLMLGLKAHPMVDVHLRYRAQALAALKQMRLPSSELPPKLGRPPGRRL
jgi:hypothetical protein